MNGGAGKIGGNVAFIRQNGAQGVAQPLDPENPRPFPWTALLIAGNGDRFVADARGPDLRKGELVAYKPAGEASDLTYSLQNGAMAAEVVDLRSNYAGALTGGWRYLGACIAGTVAAMMRDRTNVWLQD